MAVYSRFVFHLKGHSREDTFIWAKCVLVISAKKIANICKHRLSLALFLTRQNWNFAKAFNFFSVIFRPMCRCTRVQQPVEPGIPQYNRYLILWRSKYFPNQISKLRCCSVVVRRCRQEQFLKIGSIWIPFPSLE